MAAKAWRAYVAYIQTYMFRSSVLVLAKYTWIVDLGAELSEKIWNLHAYREFRKKNLTKINQAPTLTESDSIISNNKSTNPMNNNIGPIYNALLTFKR